ncbi:MAG: prepilin-type N-terminal cleavage/methylation domain-containing protein, partial [Candidatus Eremiobacteraeota bacterium]|nr:prepilin-type N-terminal cleavage/methylation domain-containing protein [Candidatus Eremiobacteraeota bacterium]
MNNRGLTLIEAMVTVALVSLTLSLTASLMTMYSRGSRVADVQNNLAHSQELLLYRIRSEAMGAVAIQSPSGTGAGYQPDFKFQRVDRNLPSRLEDFPPNWTPYGVGGSAPIDGFLVDISYRSQDGRLFRGVKPTNETTYREGLLLPADVVSFGVRRPDPETIELQLEIQT